MKNQQQIAWFAGLFEGEGCITRQPRKAICLQISSTDLDVLQKAVSIMGGRIKGPRHDGNPKHKPRYEWYLTSINEVMDVVNLIRPWLCSRRKQQISVAMSGLIRQPERRVLVTAKECGKVSPEAITTSGAKSHIRRGEKPCSSCAQAYRNYLRQWRARRKEEEANP